MQKFIVWVRLDAYRQAQVPIYASHYNEAQMLAEAQYGKGSVISVFAPNDES